MDRSMITKMIETKEAKLSDIWTKLSNPDLDPQEMEDYQRTHSFIKGQISILKWIIS